jgi:hypothetical protein
VDGLAGSSGAVIKAVDAGFFNAPPKAHPTTVYVVSYRDGHLRSFSGAPTFADRIQSKFCYMVDTSEQHSANTCTVTSSDDAYSFSVELSATWRVTDPEAAVRANLTDGNSRVLGSLEDLVWQTARGYEPGRAAAAEGAVRARLSRPVPLEAGITVLRAAARFRADAAVTEATRGLDSDKHQGNLERQRMARLQSMFDGSEASALMMHMMQHPEDTATVLGMLKDNREKEQALRLGLLEGDRRHYLAMLDRALENNLINDDDAQPLRDMLFNPAAGASLSSGSVSMVPIAPRPALSLPPGAGPAGGAAATGPVTAPQAPYGQAQPGQAQYGQAPQGQAQYGQAGAAAPPVAQGWVVEDVVDSGPASGAPASPADSAAAEQAGPGPAGNAPGGVRKWRQLKPGQGPS